jgi:hypothetical protein
LVVLRRSLFKRECAEGSHVTYSPENVVVYVDDSTYFPSSSVPPLVRISALLSTVGIIFFQCDPRNSITSHEGTAGEQRYSCTLSLTLALEGVGGQRHAPAALPSGIIRHPLYRRLGGPQGRPGRVRKISTPTRIRFPAPSPGTGHVIYKSYGLLRKLR